jgi:hypothetical protein
MAEAGNITRRELAVAVAMLIATIIGNGWIAAWSLSRQITTLELGQKQNGIRIKAVEVELADHRVNIFMIPVLANQISELKNQNGSNK